MKSKYKSPTINGNSSRVDNSIHIDQHEGTIICSVELKTTQTYEELINLLTLELESLTTYIDKIGGFIGHIKAFLDEPGRSMLLSTTGDSINKKESQTHTILLRLNIIVLGVKKSDIYHKVSEMLHAILTA